MLNRQVGSTRIVEMDLPVPARGTPQTMPSELCKSAWLLLGTKHSCQITESSYSPFLSQPATLSTMFIGLGIRSLAERGAETLDT